MTLGLMNALFLLAIWAIVPLGLRVLPDAAPIRLARRLQPVAAGLATVSLFLPTGPLAAVLAAAWLGLDGLVALGGLVVMRPSFRGGVPSLLILAAMVLPTVGGVNLVASRLGYALAGFPEPIILLTAIHFHYTAFAAPILASLSGRSGLAALSGLGVVGGTPLLAAGFLCSPILKAVGVGVLCISMIGLALGQLGQAPTLPHRRSRILLRISSVAVLAGMLLAGIYEHGYATGRTWLSIPEMAWSHGILNGVGFSLLGLLAWKPVRGDSPRGSAPPRGDSPTAESGLGTRGRNAPPTGVGGAPRGRRLDPSAPADA
ncbi:MAG TPA: YndJ family protein [Planctomycetota bacterium]|nr:YndJ family protein [Planctomycetota bacterium]